MQHFAAENFINKFVAPDFEKHLFLSHLAMVERAASGWKMQKISMSWAKGKGTWYFLLLTTSFAYRK